MMNERDLYIETIADITRSSIEMIAELFHLFRLSGLDNWSEAENHLEQIHPHLSPQLREQLRSAWEMGI